jgi:hypothetical protein
MVLSSKTKSMILRIENEPFISRKVKELLCKMYEGQMSELDEQPRANIPVGRIPIRIASDFVGSDNRNPANSLQGPTQNIQIRQDPMER